MPDTRISHITWHDTDLFVRCPTCQCLIRVISKAVVGKSSGERFINLEAICPTCGKYRYFRVGGNDDLYTRQKRGGEGSAHRLSRLHQHSV